MGQIATPLSIARSAELINPTRPLGRILVVEDDPSVQKALKRLFESEGYAVEVQGNGQSALESFQAAPPAVIILDLRLPKLSGSDLCKEVKAQAPTLPIVVSQRNQRRFRQSSTAGVGRGRLCNQALQPQGAAGSRPRGAAAYAQKPNVTVVSFDDIRLTSRKWKFSARARL